MLLGAFGSWEPLGLGSFWVLGAFGFGTDSKPKSSGPGRGICLGAAGGLALGRLGGVPWGPFIMSDSVFHLSTFEYLSIDPCV